MARIRSLIAGAMDSNTGLSRDYHDEKNEFVLQKSCYTIENNDEDSVDTDWDEIRIGTSDVLTWRVKEGGIQRRSPVFVSAMMLLLVGTAHPASSFITTTQTTAAMKEGAVSRITHPTQSSFCLSETRMVDISLPLRVGYQRIHKLSTKSSMAMTGGSQDEEKNNINRDYGNSHNYDETSTATTITSNKKKEEPLSSSSSPSENDSHSSSSSTSSSSPTPSLTKQEQILLELGLATPESNAERAKREEQRRESAQKLRREKQTNIIIALTSFALAIVNYFYQYTHPMSAVEILSRMQHDSDPITVIGTNGKPTVVDFWAPWCENCKASAPTLHAIEEEYKDRVNFILVNGDAPEGWNLVERFNVDAIPHLALIDEEGVVETALIGPVPRSVLRADLDVLLDNAQQVSESSSSSSMEEEGGGQVVGKEGNLESETEAVQRKSKKDLPFKMFDAFQNNPEKRRVRF